MRWRRVIRKSAKWGGTAAAIVLLALWIATNWWGAVRMKQNWTLVVGTGGFEFVYMPVGVPPPPVYDRWLTFGPGCEYPSMGRFSWWFDFTSDPASWGCFLPIWSLSLMAALVAAAGWTFDAIIRRRARIGACPSCGYNLTGLAPGATCPECGAKPAAA